MKPAYRIFSPVVSGSGVAVVHRQLAAGLPGYETASYSPNWEYLPFAMPMLFRGRAAEMVHTNASYGCCFRRSGVPLVLTFHGFVLDRFMRQFSSPLQRLHYATDLRWFTRRSLQQAQGVTAVSRFVAELVTRELGYRGTIQVIHNGVDCERFRPVPRQAGELRVLFSGNLRSQKGTDLLVAIAARLPPGVKLLYTRGLRGRGALPSLPQLESLGTVAHADMPARYQAADILLAPSVREGFGLGVAEAMASGLPVVATDGSSMPELVVEGQGGFLCPLGDADAFAERIRRLLDDGLLRRRMGEFNRDRAERLFGLPLMLQRYRELFDRVYGAT